MLLNLDLVGVAASSGSACTTGDVEPSHVLTAMGVYRQRGARPSAPDARPQHDRRRRDFVLEHLPGIVERLRALSTRPV